MVNGKVTPGPWHVNAIEGKTGRILGDETSTGWSKLYISGTNNTVASVYRSKDARLIAAAPNLLAFVEALILDYDKTEGQMTGQRPEWYVRARMEAAAARGEAAGAEGGRG